MNLKQIKSNIYQIDSNKPGKKIIVLGGVHGSEKTGIAVVEKMINLFEKNKINLVNGSIVLALGNEKAIEANKRMVREGGDLNRYFSQEKLNNLEDASYEANRARELAKIIDGVDVLLDIHSTLTPSRAFLACENEPKHYAIHKWFSAQDVITDPNYILSGGDYSTTDEYMNARGGVGVCFETGYAKDTSTADKVVESILNIFANQGMIEREVQSDSVCKDRNVYKMHTRIDLTEKGFRYEKGFGKGDFEKIEKGQVIGYHGKEVYKSPVTGIILFQVPKEMWSEMGCVGFIAEKI